jgi:hypothetical protein
LFAVVACDKPAPAVATDAGAAASAEPIASSPPVADAAAGATTAPLAPPESIIAQHILCAYKGAKRAPKGVTRSKADAKARAQEALAKVRAAMPFEEAVKAYSDDTGSVDRMGSVGKFRREDMDPAFSAAAFGLRVGEVSDVVETPFGFHIIKRSQ